MITSMIECVLPLVCAVECTRTDRRAVYRSCFTARYVAHRTNTHQKKKRGSDESQFTRVSGFPWFSGGENVYVCNGTRATRVLFQFLVVDPNRHHPYAVCTRAYAYTHMRDTLRK